MLVPLVCPESVPHRQKGDCIKMHGVYVWWVPQSLVPCTVHMEPLPCLTDRYRVHDFAQEEWTAFISPRLSSLSVDMELVARCVASTWRGCMVRSLLQLFHPCVDVLLLLVCDIWRQVHSMTTHRCTLPLRR